MRRLQSGFTIVELLIVVVVIAILAAITIVGYNGIQNQAKSSAAQSAVKQGYKKILAFATQNAEQYPSNLAGTGLTNSGDTSFQYRADNSVNPKVFCLTATTNTTSYFVSQANGSPLPGACAGHGGAEISNATVNPSCELNASYINMYGGSTGTHLASGTADSGNNVCRILRGTDGAGLLAMVYPIPYPANTPVSAKFKIRLTPGSRTTNSIVSAIYTYQGGSGAGPVTGCSAQSISSLSATAWTEVTFEGCTTPNITMNSIGIQISPQQTWLASEGVEIDSIMVVNSSTAKTFADGNSPGWIWDGTPNITTSRGPAL